MRFASPVSSNDAIDTPFVITGVFHNYDKCVSFVCYVDAKCLSGVHI